MGGDNPRPACFGESGDRRTGGLKPDGAMSRAASKRRPRNVGRVLSRSTCELARFGGLLFYLARGEKK